jgi:hypothetical protein
MTNTQVDPTSGLAINCHNCVHCDRRDDDPHYDRCMKCGGVHCSSVHMCPKLFGELCYNYSAWSPRPPKPPKQKSILELISDKIRKMLSDS